MLNTYLEIHFAQKVRINKFYGFQEGILMKDIFESQFSAFVKHQFIDCYYSLIMSLNFVCLKHMKLNSIYTVFLVRGVLVHILCSFLQFSCSYKGMHLLDFIFFVTLLIVYSNISGSKIDVTNMYS